METLDIKIVFTARCYAERSVLLRQFVRLSVPSVTFSYRGLIGWTTSKTVSWTSLSMVKW